MEKIKWTKPKPVLKSKNIVLISGFFVISKNKRFYSLCNGSQYMGEYNKLSSAKIVANLLRNG